MTNKKPIIFTICAMNYYGLAQILKGSLAASNPNCEFRVFIADGIPDETRPELFEDAIDGFEILKAYLGEDKALQMAFKYNITEFCTALKPFCMRYILEKLNVKSSIYLDPDIYVVDDLAEIFDILKLKSIILTPHIVHPSLTEGKRADSGLLATGIFNLGFIGVSNTKVGRDLLAWWSQRLENQCYIDNHNSLFTDQKWMDFIPSLFNAEDVHYFRGMGANLAPWNFHERKIIESSDNKYSVVKREMVDGFTENVDIRMDKLLFIHFSGFDYKGFCEGSISQNNIPGLNLYDDLNIFLNMYMKKLSENKNLIIKFLDLKYRFSSFTNGIAILSFHRRLYRALIDQGINYTKPFDSLYGEYYLSLHKSSLLSRSKKTSSLDKLTKNNYKGLASKLKLINRFMRLIKIIVGIDNYIILLKFMRPYSRAEAQLHLIDSSFNDLN